MVCRCLWFGVFGWLLLLCGVALIVLSFVILCLLFCVVDVVLFGAGCARII